MTIYSNTRSIKPADNTTPQYPMDDGPLSAAQLRQIRRLAPQSKKRSQRSSLLDRKLTEK